MLMMSHYELHDDELAWWHSSLSESHRIARVRHELIAAMRYDQLRCLASALWRCLIVLTISVRQAAVAAQRTMTFQYDRPLERHS